jgi:hypothetical protein
VNGKSVASRGDVRQGECVRLGCCLEFVDAVLGFWQNRLENWQARRGSKWVELLPITFHSSGAVGVA